MNIANLLKQKRLEKKMTMEKLAQLLNVNSGTISRWESGFIQKIRGDKITLLSKYLDIPLEILLSATNGTTTSYEDATILKVVNLMTKMIKETREKVLEYTEFLANKEKK